MGMEDPVEAPSSMVRLETAFLSSRGGCLAFPGLNLPEFSTTSFAPGSTPLPWREVCGRGPVSPRNALRYIPPTDLNGELVAVIEKL